MWRVLGLGLSLAACCFSAAAHAQALATTPVGELVHLRAAAGPEGMIVGSDYDLRVEHGDGRAGAAKFDGSRSGLGAVFVGGVGFAGRRWATGINFEYAKLHAPLRHAYLDEIGARFATELARLGIGPFFDVRFNSRWHAGAALLVARVREKMASPESQTHAHGTYGLSVFAGYRYPLTSGLALDLSLRTGFVDPCPPCVLSFGYAEEPFIGTVTDAVMASLLLGVEYR